MPGVSAPTSCRTGIVFSDKRGRLNTLDGDGVVRKVSFTQRVARRLLQKNDRICYIVVHCLFTSAVPKRTRFTATQEDKMLDYRFPTALQMVLSVAMAEQLGQRSTSAILAYGLEANPSFIRKLMVPLTRDGIIVSTLGRNGSIHLGRPAESITLRDIYVSVIEDKKLWASRPDVPARCVVSANACWYFKSIADEAEQASLNVLAAIPWQARWKRSKRRYQRLRSATGTGYPEKAH
jgi:Rrf2 family transcriptional repressor of oqxAB